jgi:hypothetical protein
MPNALSEEKNCGIELVRDRSFRNYGAGNVAYDRRPQTVALIKLTAGPSR